MKTQLIELKVPFPVLFLAYTITRNETLRKQNTFCVVVFTPFLPSETGAGEPQHNRNNPLLAIEVWSVYLDA